MYRVATTNKIYVSPQSIQTQAAAFQQNLQTQVTSFKQAQVETFQNELIVIMNNYIRQQVEQKETLTALETFEKKINSA